MDEDILTSWAEIEKYLNLTRMTIISRAYPVYTMAYSNKAFARKSDLDKHTASLYEPGEPKKYKPKA
jgi:hypothetical protein